MALKDNHARQWKLLQDSSMFLYSCAALFEHEFEELKQPYRTKGKVVRNLVYKALEYFFAAYGILRLGQWLIHRIP